MKVTFALAAFIRVAFIVYGTWHDKHMEVPYTDIDYTVFTKGAQHVVDGQSPYKTKEYKYTPLLAYMLVPNLTVHELYGKVLFSLFDLVVGYMLLATLSSLDWFSEGASAVAVGLSWLFNPFVIIISTRGSAEAAQALFVVATVYFLLHKRLFTAGLLFGLSVHFKLYPVIYALPFLLYIEYGNKRGSHPDGLVRTVVKLALGPAGHSFRFGAALSFIGLSVYMCVR